MARTYATPAAVIVISVLFPSLGIIVVSLRLYSRNKARIKLWLDDWLTIAALMVEFVVAGLMIWGAVTKSLGDTLPKPSAPGPNSYLFSTSDRQIRLQQIQYYVDLAGVFAFGFLKLSILFFFRRLFCSGLGGRTVFSIVTTIMIAVVTTWTTAFGIGAIFLCGTHPANAWAPVAVVAEKCSAQLRFLEGYAISDFIMDVIIWTLPIPQILRLHMSLRRKCAVIAVFLVGLLTIAASAARMAIYIRYIVNAFAQSDGETLITYLLFWTMIECGLGVVVVCMPTIRPLYGKISIGPVWSSLRSAFSLRSLLHSRSKLESDRIPLSSFDHSRNVSLPKTIFGGDVESCTQTFVSSLETEENQTFHGPGIRVKKELKNEVQNSATVV